MIKKLIRKLILWALPDVRLCRNCKVVEMDSEDFRNIDKRCEVACGGFVGEVVRKNKDSAIVRLHHGALIEVLAEDIKIIKK